MPCVLVRGDGRIDGKGDAAEGGEADLSRGERSAARDQARTEETRVKRRIKRETQAARVERETRAVRVERETQAERDQSDGEATGVNKTDRYVTYQRGSQVTRGRW